MHQKRGEAGASDALTIKLDHKVGAAQKNPFRLEIARPTRLQQASILPVSLGVIQFMEKPHASISKIELSGGQEFSFGPREKVILVGPNNSGKSQALREIMQIAQNGDQSRPVVIKRVAFEKTGSQDDLKEFFERHGEYREGPYR